MKNNKPIHKVLARQLSRLSLSTDIMPNDAERWNNFLTSINNSYIEADQDRYILERSSEVASHKMMVLNNRLKEAQQIAKIGYFSYELESNKTYYSDEFYTLFGIPVNTPPPTFEQILMMVYKDDRDNFTRDFARSQKELTVIENEFRLKTPKNPYRWYHLIFYPVLDVDKKVQKITGIAMDINNRKQAEENIALLNQQLVASARKAGMADVATSILHNVGNILNSANVGLSLIEESFNQSIIKKVISVFQMLETNKNNLNQFLTEDQKGKLILPYLISIAQNLESEHQSQHSEIINLTTHLNHIREIIDMQQNISGKSVLIEPISIKDMIETALKMSTHKSGDKTILIEQSYETQDSFHTDKSKLLQILVNLIQNAKDAILSNSKSNDKKIRIKVKKQNNEMLKLYISDSGIGVASEDKVKIFSFGFTKKEGGHGYGLHASALFAKELGGSLELESEGVGKGATFILSLPFHTPEKNRSILS